MLNLERADLLQLEPISHRGTLKLLPIGKKNKQKLVIADDSGQISCYEFKKGEPQVVFQSKIFEGPITSVALGGNPQKRDKIFASHSQRIIGITKKGKEFFKLTSSLTETIQSIAVEDTRIWTGCEHIYNLFDNGKDAAYYVARGQINELLVSHLTRESDFDAILACQDKYIRIIHGSQLYLEIPINNPVTALAQLELDDNATNMASRPRYLLYGTTKGEVGLVQLSTNGTFEILWEVADEEHKSEVTCLASCDVNKDGVSEVIVGRHDGRVEVFKLQPENILLSPSRIFVRDLGQSIRSLCCGVVNTPDYVEIIVAAYNGKIVSFTTEPVRARAAEDTYGRSIQTVNNENRIKFLKKEVEDLKKKVEKEREKVKKLNLPANLGNQSKATADFGVNAKFDLDTSLAAYSLLIELQVPMDLVILQCPVVFDLIDTERTGNSVLSVTPPHLQPPTPSVDAGMSTSSTPSPGADMSNKYVAVFRCQSNERRMSLMLRSNEGEYGELTITVVAHTQPKAAKIVKFELKPLSLHSKIHKLTTEQMSRPRHRVKYMGNFGLPLLYEWMSSLFPDLPPHLDDAPTPTPGGPTPSQLSEHMHYYKNTFTGAITTLVMTRGVVTIESESASTIAIAKETITRLANYRRVQLEEAVTVSEAAIEGFVNLIRDKLEYQLDLSRKMLLVDAIQELAQIPPDSVSAPSNSTVSTNPQPGAWLPEEYQDILQNQESIRSEHKLRVKSMDYLVGILTDLYVDYYRIQGVDVKHKLGIMAKFLTDMGAAGLGRGVDKDEYFKGILKFFKK